MSSKQPEPEYLLWLRALDLEASSVSHLTRLEQAIWEVVRAGVDEVDLQVLEPECRDAVLLAKFDDPEVVGQLRELQGCFDQLRARGAESGPLMVFVRDVGRVAATVRMAFEDGFEAGVRHTLEEFEGRHPKASSPSTACETCICIEEDTAFS